MCQSTSWNLIGALSLKQLTWFPGAPACGRTAAMSSVGAGGVTAGHRYAPESKTDADCLVALSLRQYVTSASFPAKVRGGVVVGEGQLASNKNKPPKIIPLSSRASKVPFPRGTAHPKSQICS
ncbi:hypothetical protein AAFF_G00288050 [Aldrovandia affinis]|uniref:Uncharacterized protein n=1 Tax=Aldrovandia affinis TaxID=143900 RepID=A0AAD7WSW0_9TELE|nr:hypothetical protein AAFF_G00288050 [Aldrovandia affinis]